MAPKETAGSNPLSKLPLRRRTEGGQDGLTGTRCPLIQTGGQPPSGVAIPSLQGLSVVDLY